MKVCEERHRGVAEIFYDDVQTICPMCALINVIKRHTLDLQIKRQTIQTLSEALSQAPKPLMKMSWESSDAYSMSLP